jgi:subtilisin family serine protease
MMGTASSAAVMLLLLLHLGVSSAERVIVYSLTETAEQLIAGAPAGSLNVRRIISNTKTKLALGAFAAELTDEAVRHFASRNAFVVPDAKVSIRPPPAPSATADKQHLDGDGKDAEAKTATATDISPDAEAKTATATDTSPEAADSFPEQPITVQTATNPETANYFPLPYGLDRIDQPLLPLDEAYAPSNRGAGVHIFVIDTGIYAEHVEFGGGRLGNGYDFVESDEDPSIGADCICNEGFPYFPPSDISAHGTHTAGTAAGATVGVASEAIIHAVR